MTRESGGLSMTELLQLPEEERLLVNRALRRRDLTLERAIAFGRDRGQAEPEVWAKALLQRLIEANILELQPAEPDGKPHYCVKLAWRRSSDGEQAWLGFTDSTGQGSSTPE